MLRLTSFLALTRAGSGSPHTWRDLGPSANSKAYAFIIQPWKERITLLLFLFLFCRSLFLSFFLCGTSSCSRMIIQYAMANSITLPLSLTIVAVSLSRSTTKRFSIARRVARSLTRSHSLTQTHPLIGWHGHSRASCRQIQLRRCQRLLESLLVACHRHIFRVLFLVLCRVTLMTVVVDIAIVNHIRLHTIVS